MGSCFRRSREGRQLRLSAAAVEDQWRISDVSPRRSPFARHNWCGSYAIASQTVFKLGGSRYLATVGTFPVHDMIRSQDLLSKELIFDGSWLCAVLWNPFGTVDQMLSVYMCAYAWTRDGPRTILHLRNELQPHCHRQLGKASYS